MVDAPATGNTATAPCVLLTLGRLPVALELARGFHAMGWRVLVAEPYVMHLCRMSRAVQRSFRVTAPREDLAAYLQELGSIIREQGVSLLVPVSEETMHVAALGEQHLPGLRLACSSQQQLLELHDKYRFNQLAASFGLAVPESAPAGSAAAAGLVSRHETVLKPRHSSSGRGVRFLQRGSEPPVLDDGIVQQRLHGEPLSSFSLARGGELLASVVYRPALMSGSVAVCFERVASAPGVDEWVQRFVQQSGHSGFIAFDFIVDGQGRAQAIECNPRTTSGLHFFHPASVAAALAGPDAAAPQAHPASLQGESWSAFTACLGTLFSAKNMRRSWASLRAARDVSWSRSDPWPFLLMMINTAPLIARALWHRQTFAEVASLDIEYLPGDPDGTGPGKTALEP
jgi:predicted ATP-grasp superfamily ATP-dependent carboligase